MTHLDCLDGNRMLLLCCDLYSPGQLGAMCRWCPSVFTEFCETVLWVLGAARPTEDVKLSVAARLLLAQACRTVIGRRHVGTMRCSQNQREARPGRRQRQRRSWNGQTRYITADCDLIFLYSLICSHNFIETSVEINQSQSEV